MDNGVNNNENQPTIESSVTQEIPVVTNPVQEQPVIESSVTQEIPVVTNPVQEQPVIESSVTQEMPVVNNNVEEKEAPVISHAVHDASVIVTSASKDLPVEDKNTSNTQTDRTAVINEKLKQVEINYTPPSKAKVVLLVLFFIALLGFIIFLPDITSYMRALQSGGTVEEKITTGRLTCTLDSNTKDIDKNYELVFHFESNKLQKTSITITTRGDASLDEEKLNALADTCKQLKKNVEKIDGVSIQCEYLDGRLVETQNYDLASLDSTKLDSAFSEAGGVKPEYEKDQDIDKLERNMNASGYSCKRER